MNLKEIASVSDSKRSRVLEKIKRLGINPLDIDEQFTRGGGKGGQKINKTSNAVLLFYAPLKITVRVQRERQRSLNRFLALRELVDQIEMIVSPHTSERMKDRERIRKQKNRRTRRALSPP